MGGCVGATSFAANITGPCKVASCPAAQSSVFIVKVASLLRSECPAARAIFGLSGCFFSSSSVLPSRKGQRPSELPAHSSCRAAGDESRPPLSISCIEPHSRQPANHGDRRHAPSTILSDPLLSRRGNTPFRKRENLPSPEVTRPLGQQRLCEPPSLLVFPSVAWFSLWQGGTSQRASVAEGCFSEERLPVRLSCEGSGFLGGLALPTVPVCFPVFDLTSLSGHNTAVQCLPTSLPEGGQRPAW